MYQGQHKRRANRALALYHFYAQKGHTRRHMRVFVGSFPVFTDSKDMGTRLAHSQPTSFSLEWIITSSFSRFYRWFVARAPQFAPSTIGVYLSEGVLQLE